MVMIADKTVSVVVTCLTEQEWQVHLTKAIIAIAYATTKVPFELVVSECGPMVPQLKNLKYPNYKYCWNPDKGFANRDQNKGWDLATGDIVVHLTNDVFVKPGWLEAIMKCFEIPDCGMASLGTSDHGDQPIDVIMEGLWCPLMALPNTPDLRFDAEAFPSYWGDSDLVMQVYSKGLRAYRNRSVVCDHLGRATNTSDHVRGKVQEIEDAKNRFVARWGVSPCSLIYRVLMDGLII